jgi:hypothetical protein
MQSHKAEQQNTNTESRQHETKRAKANQTEQNNKIRIQNASVDEKRCKRWQLLGINADAEACSGLGMGQPIRSD